MKTKLLVLLIAGTLSIVIATTTTTFTNLFAQGEGNYLMAATYTDMV